jgi:cysteine desulfurase/selenocysteine lyase
MQTQELQTLRADTPGAGEVIHFNNAGGSLTTATVLNTVLEYLREEALQGAYEIEARYRDKLQEVYVLIGKLIHARPDEIALVENASTAWHLAFNGIDFQPGDEVITSEMEYVTNHIGFLNLQQLKGIRIIVVPNNADGDFDLASLEPAISSKTKLIAITHIPSTAGNILPVEAIGAIARRHNILYLVDACQSAGHIALDVEAIGCDMLAATGRKYLRGPRGTGFLYVRKGVQDQLRPYFLDGHSVATVGEQGFQLHDSARRFELYEKNRALVLGLGAAMHYALELGLDRIEKRIVGLATHLRNNLASTPGITVHDKGNRLSGIVTFSVAGLPAEKVKAILQENKINVSVGKALSTLIYMNRSHLTAVVRASVHYYNTEEEIDALCVILAALFDPRPHL